MPTDTLRSMAVMVALTAATLSPVNAGAALQESPAADLAPADPIDRWMKLISAVRRFESLGDPSSEPGRTLKRLLLDESERREAMRVATAIAIDPAEPIARRRDAMRLISAALGRAAGKDAVGALVADEAIAERLPALRAALTADARTQIDAVIAGGAVDPYATEGDDRIVEPAVLLPIELIALAHLGAADEVLALHDAALAAMAKRREADPAARPIPDRLYWQTEFPTGTFVWPLGVVGSEAATSRLLRMFEEAERSGRHSEIAAVLDALQHLKEPDPALLDRIRTLVAAKWQPKDVELPPGTDPRVLESAPWADVAETLRTGSIRLVQLGQKRFQTSGDLAWLDALFGWIQAVPGQHEPETLTTWRGANAALALLEVTDPRLQAVVVERILPLLGSGNPKLRDHVYDIALAAMVKPTEGRGSARRVTAPYAEALAAQFVRAGGRGGAQPIETCGMWGNLPTLTQPVRAAFTTAPRATRVYAHLVGSAARAELEALRAGGPFEGNLPEEVKAEQARLLAMAAESSETTADETANTLHRRLQQAGVAEDAITQRCDRFRERFLALITREEFAAHESPSAFRDAVLERTVGLLNEAAGEAKANADDGNRAEELTYARHQVRMLGELWQSVERMTYDWHLRQALALLDITDRLESNDPAKIREGLRLLRERRVRLQWEIGDFDVYAWVPRIIALYEEAPGRFPSEADAIRKDILSTLAEFRSVIGREFLAAAIADPTTPEPLRAYAASLRPARIPRLYREAD